MAKYNEKLEILEGNEEGILNRRCEIVSECLHQNKYELGQPVRKEAIRYHIVLLY